MIRVSLVGHGNLGSLLAKIFHQLECVELVCHYSRNRSDSKTTSDLTQILKTPTDICFICVSDDVICELSKKLKDLKCLVAHTSGAVPLEALISHKRRGVFYPLQTFKKEQKIDWKEIPILIEATMDTDLQLLQSLASKISQKVLALSSEKRLQIHLAAVFANNFTNAMYACAEEICIAHHLAFKLLHPIIQKTAQSAIENSPKKTQTGPAKRKDIKTLEKHLSLLEDHKKDIYRVINRFIQNQDDREKLQTPTEKN